MQHMQLVFRVSIARLGILFSMEALLMLECKKRSVTTRIIETDWSVREKWLGWAQAILIRLPDTDIVVAPFSYCRQSLGNPSD